MLGRFLELSLATPDIQASLNFYRGLGFSEAQVGEAWPHPYAVVTDGRIALGLHQEDIPSPMLTFVKPDLLKHLPELELRGIAFEYRHLGGDVFNEVGWAAIHGHPLRLVEARTFSPAKRAATDTSKCGYFLEIGLPAPDRESAKAYWESLGFVGMDELDDPLPHVSCTSDSIDVGLYAPADLRRLTLRFEVEDLAASLASLGEAGVTATGTLPQALRAAPAALLLAPEGTPILLAEAAPG